ncbi:hypothetical protein [Chromobacterium piscinae]|uniref:hypothetical protein n=1 Tax=Chromobacterium piscinae TaxID=686831 RepID=UPI00320B8FDA
MPYDLWFIFNLVLPFIGIFFIAFALYMKNIPFKIEDLTFDGFLFLYSFLVLAASSGDLYNATQLEQISLRAVAVLVGIFSCACYAGLAFNSISNELAKKGTSNNINEEKNEIDKRKAFFISFGFAILSAIISARAHRIVS